MCHALKYLQNTPLWVKNTVGALLWLAAGIWFMIYISSGGLPFGGRAPF
jgi:hypothetical protein